MTPLRLGLIGGGRIAQVAHLPAIEKSHDVELVAVCDPSAEVAQALAARYGAASASTDAAPIWADPSIDAVLITAPDRFHLALATAALAAGKHVLVEKPVASTTEQAAELVDTVDRSGLVLQVGAMKRHDEGIQHARRAVATDIGTVRSFNAWYRIGDLRTGIEATLFPPVVADSDARRHEAGFKSDRQRYLLATHGAHVFDTVRFLLGDVASVVAIHREDDRDHAWQILLTTTAGAVGSVSVTADVPGLPSEGIEVFGSTGSVRVDTHFPFSRRSSDVQVYSAGVMTSPTLTDGDAYQRQVEAFARAIRERGRPDPDVRDGLAALRLIEAVAQAAETGATVLV